MSKIIVEQPNGKYALFDWNSIEFLMINMSIEEIRDHLIEKEIARIDSDIISFFEIRKSDFTSPHDPWFKTMINNVIEEHGNDDFSLCQLRETGVLA